MALPGPAFTVHSQLAVVRRARNISGAVVRRRLARRGILRSPLRRTDGPLEFLLLREREEQLDEIRVELRSGRIRQAAYGLGVDQGSPVRTAGGHGVVRVDDRDHQRSERNLVRPRARRIAAAVVALVVVQDDRKDIFQLSDEIAQVAEKARGRKLSLDDMQGGSFTISNLGSLGGGPFSPIVNWPEVAILGVARAKMEPVWADNGVVPRLMVAAAS